MSNFGVSSPGITGLSAGPFGGYDVRSILSVTSSMMPMGMAPTMRASTVSSSVHMLGLGAASPALALCLK